MKASRKFISLPIISLSEGQHIGYVKSLVIDAHAKSIAALVLDPKGFFKDQRIIPYSKVVSVGDDAITIDKGAYVERSNNLPEILSLLKDRLSIIGTRVITETGKTLGVAEEYYVDPSNGKILEIEISGGKLEGFFSGKALLKADFILTVGQDAIVTEKECEQQLTALDKGLNDTFKNLLHSTSSLANETSHAVQNYFRKDKPKSESPQEESVSAMKSGPPAEAVTTAQIPSDSALKPAEQAAETPPALSAPTTPAPDQAVERKEKV